jgi:zinc protease
MTNGLNVILVEHAVVPLVHLYCAVPAGAQYEPPGMEGISSLLMPLLREGAGRRNATQISEEVEAFGADILTRVDWDYGSLTVELLSEDLDFGLDLVLDLINAPLLPEPSVERFKQRQVARLKHQSCQPAELANTWFARAVYGSTHYGRPIFGSESSLSTIKRDDLVAFHRAHFGLSDAVLIGIGSFNVEALARRIDAALPQTVEERPSPTPSFDQFDPSESRIYLIDLPQAKQVEIRLGHASVPQSHPDFPRLQLLNRVLGNRLRQNLRERLGYTYYVRSRFEARNGHAPFVVAAAVGNNNAGAAVREIIHEIESLQHEPVSQLELTGAQNRMRGEFLRSFQSAYEMAIRLKHLAFNNLPSDYFQRRLEVIGHVTPDDLVHLARKYIFPQQLKIAAVGSASELQRQLAGYAEMFVIDPAE